MSEHENTQIDFADLDEAFESTEAAASGGSVDKLPDGNYEMVIANAYVATSGNSGNRMLKWRMKVTAPRLVGSSIWRNSVLEANRLAWFKKDLAVLGVELPGNKLSILNDQAWVAENIKGCVVQVTVKNNGDFCNIHFNKKMGKVTVSNEEDPAAGFQSAQADEDKPQIDPASIPF